MLFSLLLAAALGLTVGSFLNVVIARVPAGESVVAPRSRCPSCGHQLGAAENIPVVSWLALRGRCRHCSAPISAQYPLIELLTAALYVAVVAIGWGDAARIALGVILVTALVPITVIDLRTRRIPNAITLPAAVALVVAGTALDPGGQPGRLLAAAAVVAPFVLLALAFTRGMGMGDPKLMGVIALALGRAVIPAVFIAFLLGTVVGVALMVRHGARARKTALPFGPFLAAGAVIGWLYGEQLIDWYLRQF
ncbi:MAG: prepilin peptidase [Patulibacter sp.]